jgi:hypothetical protein
MWKLIIEQPKYNRVEFEYETVTECASVVGQLSPHAKDGTLFTIKLVEEENEDGETGI